jgi:hypothetical protein
MRVIATPLMGAVLILSLQHAWGASACPPLSSAPSAPAKCVRPATRKVKVAVAPVTPDPAAVSGVPASWKSVLDPLSAGGWTYISDGPPENPSAVYA